LPPAFGIKRVANLIAKNITSREQKYNISAEEKILRVSFARQFTHAATARGEANGRAFPALR
jgi:hypothetical protein